MIICRFSRVGSASPLQSVSPRGYSFKLIMKAMTFSSCCGSRTMFSIVGCEVVSQTAKAVPVMLGVLATSLKGGAFGSGEVPLSTAWIFAQTCSA